MAEPNATPRDSDNWAKPVGRLQVHDVPVGATALNVQGRRVAGALQGFGPMWEKRYQVRLSGLTLSPTELIQFWKANFPKFWPSGMHFYAPLTGIAPGEVALITAGGGSVLSTGVMVLYADEESFSFMTPEGHVFAGWITFSAFEEDGSTVARILLLIRAHDPLYELSFRLGGSRMEDIWWQKTLERLAAHFGMQGTVETRVTCVDPKIQWRYAGNIRYNAGLRSTLYTAAAPLRWLRRLVASE